MIETSDELIIIGTQLRTTDKEVRQLLHTRAKGDVEISVVGSKPTDNEMESIFGHSIRMKERYPTFASYAESL